MDDRTIQLRLGIGALLVAAFFMVFAIPAWVSAPSNVPNVILSPLFWPNVLAGVTALAGLGLLWSGARMPRAAHQSDVEDPARAYIRLSILVVIMGVSMGVIAKLGLVWTAMLVFAALAFLVRTGHPKIALASAVVVPLLLYVFFAHVAGVAIPQGDFVRLP